MVNVTKLPITLQRRMQIANVYALSASDIERIKLLHEPLPAPTEVEDNPTNETGPTPTEPSPTKVDLTDTNMGQLNPRVDVKLLDLLQEHRDKGMLFALDPRNKYQRAKASR